MKTYKKKGVESLQYSDERDFVIENCAATAQAIPEPILKKEDNLLRAFTIGGKARFINKIKNTLSFYG